MEKRLDYTDKLLEVVYNCNMCGACDTSCKYSMDMEVIESINEIRNHCVEAGHTNPTLDKVISNLRKLGSMVPGSPAKRGEWAEGLGLKDCTKEKVDVVFHVGCQTSFNKNMWHLAQTTAKLLQNAGVNFGVAGENETCCGGRAYQMGYRDDFLAQAKKNMEMIKKSGANTLITGCADGYQAFKVLYDQYGFKGDLEVLHVTEYLDRLIKENKLTLTKPVDMVVTYHDPCHLGRMGEHYIHWEGREVIDEIRTLDPPREYRRGTYGVYEAPRDLLRSIPGLKPVEMDRIKEYAWCCGSGGGVSESNPEFSMWTARSIPPAVNDLSYHLDGNTLNLTWNIPLEEQNTTVKPAGCIVYRSKIELSGHDCQKCPEQFKPIADILVESDASGKNVQKKMTHRERLEKRYRYTYKVTLYTPSGVFSNDSNYVVFIYE